jgi:hypothetical protein
VTTVTIIGVTDERIVHATTLQLTSRPQESNA